MPPASARVELRLRGLAPRKPPGEGPPAGGGGGGARPPPRVRERHGCRVGAWRGAVRGARACRWPWATTTTHLHPGQSRPLLPPPSPGADLTTAPTWGG